MRNFSNQNSEKTPGGNRGGYNRSGSAGNRSAGGYNRENRGSGGSSGYNRESRGSSGSSGNIGSSGYNRENRGGAGRYERGEQRYGGPPRPSSRPPYQERNERPERHERSEGYSSSRPSSWVEITGRTAEEAIEEAARRFNVKQEDLKTETVAEGSRGFLGIGSKPASVKVALKPNAVMPFAEGVLTRILRGMGLPDNVKSQKDSDGTSVLNIVGPSSGALIGRHGHTLESLQYLVSKVVQRMTGDEKTIIVVDVESYLERQKDKLRELALNLAQKTKETGVEIPMRPMSSKDRRIVHMALKDHAHVTTESRGEGLRRKVVIIPKVKAPAVSQQPASTAEPSVPAVEADASAPVESQSTPTPDENPAEGQLDLVKAPEPTPIVTENTGEKPEPGNAAPRPPSDMDDDIGNK
jgi:spoIIIJ-associated protein